MRVIPVFLAIFLIVLTVPDGSAESQWSNNITVGEYGMTWGYTEIFTDMDSVIYRMGVDERFGNNDSFINAWELLETDKEMRKRLRSSIDDKLDVRIETPETPYLNTGTNGNKGIEVTDVESTLSSGIIGNTSITDTIVNKYTVSYRWKDSIINANSIWFLGQANSPVSIILPAGIDVTNISGMSNATKNIGTHTEISGFFTGISKNRGEITLELARNTSVRLPEMNVTNVTLPVMNENAVKPAADVLSKIRDGSILGAGVVLILLIYVFKVRKR